MYQLFSCCVDAWVFVMELKVNKYNNCMHKKINNFFLIKIRLIKEISELKKSYCYSFKHSVSLDLEPLLSNLGGKDNYG